MAMAVTVTMAVAVAVALTWQNRRKTAGRVDARPDA